MSPLTSFQELIQRVLDRFAEGEEGQRLTGGALGVFFVKVLGLGTTFLLSIFLTRVLGAESYGIYAYAVSWLTLLTVPMVFGLDTLLTREVARYRTNGDWSKLKGILQWSDAVALGLSLLTSAAAIGLILSGGLDVGGTTAIALCIALAVLPARAAMEIRRGALQGLGRVVEAHVPVFCTLPVAILVLCVSVYVLRGSLSAVEVMGLHGLAVFAALAAAVFLLRRRRPSVIKDVIPERSVNDWLQSAFPLVFIGLSAAVNDQISIVISGTILPLDQVGVLDVARRGSMIIYFIFFAINVAISPIIVELYTKERHDQLQKVVVIASRTAFLLAFGLGIGFFLFGRSFLAIFGPEFTAGWDALIILCAGQVVSAAVVSVAPLLNMTGFERSTALGIGLSAVLNVALNLLFIPRWGINGAALATAVSVVVWNALLYGLSRRNLGIDASLMGSTR